MQIHHPGNQGLETAILFACFAFKNLLTDIYVSDSVYLRNQFHIRYIIYLRIYKVCQAPAESGAEECEGLSRALEI